MYCTCQRPNQVQALWRSGSALTHILLSCIRKHGAVRERVKFAVYEMLQLNFRARLLLHRMPLAQRDESRSSQPNQTIPSTESISQHSNKYYYNMYCSTSITIALLFTCVGRSTFRLISIW